MRILMKSFGATLREVRGRTDRKELAEKAGFSVHYLDDLENGRYPNPTANTVFKLARALGVSSEVFAQCDYKPDTSRANKAQGRPKKAP